MRVGGRIPPTVTDNVRAGVWEAYPTPTSKRKRRAVGVGYPSYNDFIGRLLAGGYGAAASCLLLPADHPRPVVEPRCAGDGHVVAVGDAGGALREDLDAGRVGAVGEKE
jgi:hypothetical protein